ncbi:MAG: hypothetical protein U0235_18960 [Polyangiaceae bacterium]
MSFLSLCLPSRLKLSASIAATLTASALAACSSGGAGSIGDADGGTSTASGPGKPAVTGEAAGPDGGSSTKPAETCASATDCTPSQCICNDGTGARTGTTCASGVCRAVDSMCDPLCKDHGGIARIRALPNVRESAECKAFCAKALALGCGDAKCDDSFFCSYDLDECADSKRAYLQCQVDNATWSCSSSGKGWSATGGECVAPNKAGCDSR